ncbi:MAG: sodium:solute symporter [Bacteroidetes bacterium]|nr:sodium:solute symporter [Bacteroidota bacterium]
MLSLIDIIVIIVYLIGVAILGIRLGGKQRSTDDYFLGGRDLPWWAVCFSVVATETSTLTIIGVPAVSYGGTMIFLQITGGYLIGRIGVSLLLLPRYFKGAMSTAYAYLGERFGDRMRSTASLTFMVTRLLADGVRLFATAIPIKVIADTAGMTLMGEPISYFQIILLLGIITAIYTMVGGIRAVIWIDVVQMILYVVGGLLCVVLLMQGLPENWAQIAALENKFKFIDLGFDGSLTDWITQPYVALTALIGGGVFSMASHGTDQLIVQRLLTCRTLRDSQKALIGSAGLIAFQFALFLLIGVLLWIHYGGVTPLELGLSRGDEIFPKYIIEGLPPGLSGLLLAGILAAAMSTLSSSLNSLASSSMLDLVERYFRNMINDTRRLLFSRGLTLFWAGLFIVFASLFENTENPVVELGLAIASFTYGGLLGGFVLGIAVKRARETDAIISFCLTIVTMVLIIFGVWFSPDHGWMFNLNPTDSVIQEYGMQQIAWPWYTLIGSVLCVLLGSLFSLRHRFVNR